MENEQGRFTLIFLAAPGDEDAQIELTHNWDESGYGEGRNFGHVAYEVDDVYETCRRLMDAGVTINRPPREGRMAFVRTPRRHLGRAAAERRPSAGRGALGVDGECRPLVSGAEAGLTAASPPCSAAGCPILAAPMAGAGGVELAIAAIEGGGGRLAALRDAHAGRGCAPRSPRCGAGCAGPLNLNFFCHAMPEEPDDSAWRALLQPYYERVWRRARRPATGRCGGRSTRRCAPSSRSVRPEIVSFHFGLPDETLLGARAPRRRAHPRHRHHASPKRAGSPSAASTRSSPRAAKPAAMPAASSARRRRSRWGCSPCFPRSSTRPDLPVIAAGGIADGRGIAAAFMLGAAAVQIGTAFLHSPESLIGGRHRAALTSEAAERTAFTNLFSGGLARGLPTRLADELGPVRPEAPPFPLATAALIPIARAAAARGETGFLPMWSGQAARLAEPLPARELTERLGRDALALLGRRA